ncbi:phosphatidylinositol-specific phospholipase C/glycerophosphodiester phosphodiesterase family protein [Paenibacillus sp. FJAT-26967]|uniref:phosphatidylinositol-specific phospholipase C/glycerophosphodiester phosphodiesterase family protein n=1 Tax=Paenibacillus sp. FJAT-26967 TaxID=1729690 RepID=UPI00083883EA|nr:phosphatidylinositol-specific phospholipase C/glycerophosphodiester phosphodiesterase family protein [Paenibacillus sp. FJAT-26967]
MKKLLTGVLSVAIMLSLLPVQASAEEAKQPWTNETLIAHGLGSIYGQTLTNSYEAFLVNYDKGYRVFEADLILTADNELAARHDWYQYLSERLQPTLPEHLKNGPLTLAEFKKHKILKAYKPLDLDGILEILVKYPDVYFVTDTKSEDPAVYKKQFELIVKKAKAIDPALLDRIVPELFEIDMIKDVKQIHDFPNYLFSIYMTGYTEKETIALVKKHNIKAVAMPVERATASMIDGLNKLGVPTYVHTVNDPYQVKRLQQIGVHGFYSDYIDYSTPMAPKLANAGTRLGGNVAAAR